MKRRTKFHYLDHASMGRPARRTLERLHTALSNLGTFASTGTLETLKQFDALEKARTRVAQFVHADPANILLIGNTSQALGMIATALPMSRGDNILMADIEFMGATVAWRGDLAREDDWRKSCRRAVCSARELADTGDFHQLGAGSERLARGLTGDQ
jgi:selenocysteine lyase/cysteine desulfurase